MADSTCDLPKEVIERYNIGIVPLNVIIDGKSYKETVDITADEFYELLPDMEELPSTSMPSPDEYLKMIKKSIDEGFKEILCICMSSGTSGSYQSAVLAQDMFFEEFPDTDIKLHIVDSLCMSHGSGWLVMKSAEFIEKGYSFDSIVEFNETYKDRVKHFLCVDDLDNLIRSGRLRNTSAIIGKLLKVKPIMTMKNAKGAIVAKKRGAKKVLKYYVDQLNQRVDNEVTDFIIVGYTSIIEKAYDLVERIKEETDFKENIHVMQMGCTVGTHVGLGGLSMFFVEKDHMRDGFLKNELDSILVKKDELIEKIIK